MKCFVVSLFILTLVSFLSVNYALADATGQGQGAQQNNNTPGTVSLPNPIGTTNVPELLGRIINYTMGLIGSLALVMFIYGGATWMLSGGNQEHVTKGKNIIIWATLGLVLIFTAYALVKFVITTIGGA
jgi:hypothetical protein